MNILLKSIAFSLLAMAMPISSFASSTSDSNSTSTNVDNRYSINIQMTSETSMSTVETDYDYSDWEDVEEPYDCTYTPETSEVMKGVTFTQTSYCWQLQSREKYTYTYGVLTDTSTEYQETDVTHEEEAVGILTYSTEITYSSWVNSGSAYSCGTYSPSASTVSSGTSFTQSATCSQNQVRNKYTYLVNDITGASSLSGTEQESQVVSVTKTRTATGTKAVSASYQYVGAVGGLLPDALAKATKLGYTTYISSTSASCTSGNKGYAMHSSTSGGAGTSYPYVVFYLYQCE